MTSDMRQQMRELYQETILDHSRDPHNFKKLADANRAAEGDNPLCGDHVLVYLKLEDDTISGISFEGNGCAISKSSASLMTDALKGKSAKDAETLFVLFQKVVKGEVKSDDGLGKLAVFSGVSEFPARVKCAILPWHTMRAALQGDGTRVTTE